MKKDLDYIVKVEKAISKKYGSETIVNPHSLWDEDKEEEYINQLKKLAEREQKSQDSKEKLNKDGFFLSKNLINKKSKRECPVCETYSFNMKDDLYMNKFECCFKCFVQWVEDREDRWKTGWRPNKKGDN